MPLRRTAGGTRGAHILAHEKVSEDRRGRCALIPSHKQFDVLVIGGGNAGMAAAITARRAGARVLVLESAPMHSRGGNSRHTRNLRCMHAAPTGVLTGAYAEEEYWQDLLNVTGGQTNETLARLAIRESYACAEWMASVGVRFQPSLTGTLHLSRTNAFFLGGGKALLNAYYREADKLGIDIVYDAEVTGLDAADGRFSSAVVQHAGVESTVHARALVAAAGGFESNFEWLTRAWGERAQNFLVRGTPFNRGVVLRCLLDQNVRSTGDPTQCHAVAIDARSPRFDGGIVTRVDCVSLGIVVNRDGKRFHDEGEDFWPKRYAVWGRLVADQPGQIAYAMIDAKALGKFIPSVYPPIQADSIAALAVALGPRSRCDSEQTVGRVQPMRATGTLRSHRARRLRDFRACNRPRPIGRARSTIRRIPPIRCGRASRSLT